MINNIINKVGVDKILHLLVSLSLTLELKRVLPVFESALLVLTIGLLKEAYDKWLGKGTSDWKDIVANCIGVAIGCI